MPAPKTLQPVAPRALTDPAAQVAFDDLRDGWNAAILLGLLHNGVLIEGLVLPAGGSGLAEVFHGLGRIPRFVITAKATGAGAGLPVYEYSRHADPRNFINLFSDGTGTYNVLIA